MSVLTSGPTQANYQPPVAVPPSLSMHEATLNAIANQIFEIIRATQQSVRSTVTHCGGTLVMNLEGIERVYGHSICPKKWKLGRAELLHVVSSVVIQAQRILRVTLVYEPTKSAAQLEELSWAEETYGPPPLCGTIADPSCIDVGLQRKDLVNEQMLPLVVAVAQEVIASALLRSENCHATIGMPSDPAANPDVICVIVVTGLAVVSSRSMFPAQWQKLLARKVRRTLSCYYNIETGEHRTAIRDDTVFKYFGFPIPRQQPAPAPCLKRLASAEPLSILNVDTVAAANGEPARSLVTFETAPPTKKADIQ